MKFQHKFTFSVRVRYASREQEYLVLPIMPQIVSDEVAGKEGGEDNGAEGIVC